MNNRVNRIKWDKLKLRWDGRKAAAAAFKGIKDYEEWAMSLSAPLTEDELEFARGLAPLEEGPETPEDYFKLNKPRSDKERLMEQAKEIRAQLDLAIAEERYEAAEILQKTLNVIEIKYNKL